MSRLPIKFINATGVRDGTKFLRDDGAWINPPGSGGGGSGVTTVNFGAFPGASDTKITITGQTSILAGSIVDAWIVGTATADHSADEHFIDAPWVLGGNIVVGTGFDIFAQSQNFQNAGLIGDSPRPYGLWTVAWQWV